MPRGKRESGFAFARQLSKIVNKLKEQRQKHADALRSIDNIFESIGVTTHLAGEGSPRNGRSSGRPAGSRGPGRPRADANGMAAPAATWRGKRKRRKFATSGTESILSFVKGGGSKGRTTGEINKQWQSEGRSGTCYVQLGQLVKGKKLKRQNLPGERGSRYTLG